MLTKLKDIKNSFKKIEDYKRVLGKMVSFRFNKDDKEGEIDPIKSFAMKILWLESNRQYSSPV